MTELRNRDLASSPRIQGPEPQIQSWAWIFGPVDPLISPHFPLVRAEMREMRDAYWICERTGPGEPWPWSPRPDSEIPRIPLSKNSSQNRFVQLYFFRKSCKCLALTIFFLLLPRFGRFCSGAYRGIIIISCLKVDVLYSKTLLKTMSKALQSAPGSTPPRARYIIYRASSFRHESR